MMSVNDDWRMLLIIGRGGRKMTGTQNKYNTKNFIHRFPNSPDTNPNPNPNPNPNLKQFLMVLLTLPSFGIWMFSRQKGWKTATTAATTTRFNIIDKKTTISIAITTAITTTEYNIKLFQLRHLQQQHRHQRHHQQHPLIILPTKKWHMHRIHLWSRYRCHALEDL